MRRLLGREEGQTMIMVAVLMIPLLAFAGLALDLGQAAVRHRLAQNAADAAAQGAAYQIFLGRSESTATNRADTLMPPHGYTTANLTSLQFLDVSGNATTDPAGVVYVQTTVSETFNTFLLGMVGISQATASAAATVKVGPGTAPCVLCVLDPHQSGALALKGSGQATVTGGGVVVNSDDSTAATAAITVSGSAELTAPYIGVVGDYKEGGNGQFNNGGADVAPYTGVSPVPDPLIGVPDPLSTGQCGSPQPDVSLSSTGATQTISPGTYNTIKVTGGTLTMTAGVYCITGSFEVSGGGTVIGQGVTLYFTCGTSAAPAACAPGQTGGSFSATGNGGSGGTAGDGTFDLTAPTSGTYQGLLVFYDRNDTGGTVGFQVAGNGNDTFTGTIYAKAAAADLSGNGATMQTDSMFICDTAAIGGNGNLNLTYNQADNYQVPQLPVFTQ